MGKRTTGSPSPNSPSARSTAYISTAHGWYLTVGHRIDAFTPYVTYANQNQDPRLCTPVPAIHAPLVGIYNNSRNTAQHPAFGTRWDVARSIALKARSNASPRRRKAAACSPRTPWRTTSGPPRRSMS